MFSSNPLSRPYPTPERRRRPALRDRHALGKAVGARAVALVALDVVVADRLDEEGRRPHGEALQHFDWYQPTAGYSNRLLNQTDRDNLAMVRNPPPPPEEEEVPAPAPQETMAEDTGTCGCAMDPTPAVLGLMAFLPLLGRMRR